MFQAYLTAALWSSLDDNGNPLDDNYGVEDIHPDTLKSLEEELEDFVNLLNAEEVDHSEWTEEQLAHDFWLTRNGHGAGFWDRGLESGDILSNWAKIYGSCDLYVGDDGMIHAG